MAAGVTLARWHRIATSASMTRADQVARSTMHHVVEQVIAVVARALDKLLPLGMQRDQERGAGKHDDHLVARPDQRPSSDSRAPQRKSPDTTRGDQTCSTVELQNRRTGRRATKSFNIRDMPRRQRVTPPIRSTRGARRPRRRTRHCLATGDRCAGQERRRAASDARSDQIACNDPRVAIRIAPANWHRQRQRAASASSD
jgi:hypothetical protein